MNEVAEKPVRKRKLEVVPDVTVNPLQEELDKLKSDKAELVKELLQCHADWRYATKAFGQHDWMNRRFEALCEALHKHGVEVSRDPSK